MGTRALAGTSNSNIAREPAVAAPSNRNLISSCPILMCSVMPSIWFLRSDDVSLRAAPRDRRTDSSWRPVLAIPVQDDRRHRRRFARQNVDEKALAIPSRRVIVPARKPLLNTRAEELLRRASFEGGIGLHFNGHDRAGVGSIEQLFAVAPPGRLTPAGCRHEPLGVPSGKRAHVDFAATRLGRRVRKPSTVR